ncbi:MULTISPECIES: DUF262 domain-containing protein [unclassified Pseudomonas]|uniref:DUF262 domain-containing protein n=1 Tax=unclassified Pseudomonas TaxID=196821 RepID=UPI000BA415B3|nr:MULTISPECIES: DUF262 domain-containing protein [unclassified Pseudomonas]QDG58269.1 DUF262 domain-containing protein [Pseudomonas sp. NIBRBAC000502773]
MSNPNLYLNKDQFENVFKKHIKTSVYSLSIKTLFGERMTRKINYKPYYQRNYVWDLAKASFFIESILLGTDIPPLIFFLSGASIEVIDGRQRYETIKRFREGDIKLNLNGLTKLTQLRDQTYSKLDEDIKSILDNAKIRIFEFEVINEPKLETILEDKIKKEIFRRYNSGITPLNSAEIDNATYDDDDITNRLKELLGTDKELISDVAEKFIGRQLSDMSPNNATVLQFLRKYLVLSSFPINTYATGVNRSEIIDLLYNVKSSNTDDVNELCEFLALNLKACASLINSFADESIKANKLVNESLLWGLCILVENDIPREAILEESKSKIIEASIKKLLPEFISENSHHYKSIINRHQAAAKAYENAFSFSFSSFFKDENFKGVVKTLRQSEKEAKLKIAELSSLRVQKPEPSLIPIEEIISEISTNKYQLRPTYQRQEKINLYKASAIIESVILGINLPPIFIFKNKSGVKEVIDGQQRLLSILGFLGKQYQNEVGDFVYPKNVNYKLNRLKILSELDGKSYTALDVNTQEKILDFKLSVIEIDYALNNNFEPVDLFIRLNNKPYPIKENSFEMWNSFMDRDVIKKIRDITDENISWLFIKQRDTSSGVDRMLNEELIALLSYIAHCTEHRKDFKSIGFYLRDKKINCRISEKKDVSNLLERISMDVELKRSFMGSLESIEKYINLLKSKLDPADFKASLNSLINKEQSTYKRYLVDFYILFQILQRYSYEDLSQISFNEIKGKMALVQKEIKNPSKIDDAQTYQEHFSELLNSATKIEV